MPTRTLRRSAMLYDLSRVGLGGVRSAVVVVLAAATLRSPTLAWVSAGALICSLALWLACLPTDTERDRLRAQGLAMPRNR